MVRGTQEGRSTDDRASPGFQFLTFRVGHVGEEVLSTSQKYGHWQELSGRKPDCPSLGL